MVSFSLPVIALTFTTTWGVSGDTQGRADYDGDSKADVASTGQDRAMIIRPSLTGVPVQQQWGASGDTQCGRLQWDGKGQHAVYRPTTGQWIIHLRKLTCNSTMGR